MENIQSSRELRSFLFSAGLKGSEIDSAMKELMPQLGGGGIDEFELKKALRRLREEHKISNVDKGNIMENFEER